MRELEQKCGGCVWFQIKPGPGYPARAHLAEGSFPEIKDSEWIPGPQDSRDPYGLCEANFTSTRPHLPDARFEGLAIAAERYLVLERSRRALYAAFGADKFIPVETEFTKHLSVGTFSSQSCHERDDKGSLLFTPQIHYINLIFQ